MNIRDFEIISTHNNRDYVVKRHGFPKRYHSHFKRRSGAEKLLELLKDDTRADKRYFLQAQRRVTTDKEFNELKYQTKKDKYYNSSRKRTQSAGVL